MCLCCPDWKLMRSMRQLPHCHCGNTYGMRHTWKIGKCLAWVGRERIASRKTFLGCTYIPGRVRHTTDDIGQVTVQKEVEIRERSWNRIVWLFCRDSTLSGGRHSRGYGGCDQFWDGSGSGSI